LKHYRRIPRIDYTGYLDDLILGYCTEEKLAVVFRKIKSKGFKGTQRILKGKCMAELDLNCCAEKWCFPVQDNHQK